MSDISSFAEWETDNRPLDQEGVSQEAQRRRELREDLKMDLEMDSSNDGEHSSRASVILNGEPQMGGERAGYGFREVFTQDDESHISDEELADEDAEDGGAELELVSSTLGKIGWRFEKAEDEVELDGSLEPSLTQTDIDNLVSQSLSCR